MICSQVMIMIFSSKSVSKTIIIDWYHQNIIYKIILLIILRPILVIEHRMLNDCRQNEISFSKTTLAIQLAFVSYPTSIPRCWSNGVRNNLGSSYLCNHNGFKLFIKSHFYLEFIVASKHEIAIRDHSFMMSDDFWQLLTPYPH